MDQDIAAAEAERTRCINASIVRRTDAELQAILNSKAEFIVRAAAADETRRRANS